MHTYSKNKINKFICYAMMALVALIAFGVFAALPLLNGDEAWLSIPVIAAAAFFIGFIQHRCNRSDD